MNTNGFLTIVLRDASFEVKRNAAQNCKIYWKSLKSQSYSNLLGILSSLTKTKDGPPGNREDPRHVIVKSRLQVSILTLWSPASLPSIVRAWFICHNIHLFVRFLTFYISWMADYAFKEMREEKCYKLKFWILDYEMYSLKWHKNCDDEELKLDSPNPKFTFQYDDKSRGLAGQQLYNEKSAVCFDTHFNGESCYRYLLCLTGLWSPPFCQRK